MMIIMIKVNLRLLYSVESNLHRPSEVTHQTRVMAWIARTGHHPIRHLIAVPMYKSKYVCYFDDDEEEGIVEPEEDEDENEEDVRRAIAVTAAVAVAAADA